MPNFDRLLNIFDLKERKAAVYLATLELGSATVTPIARKAGVLRTTTYDLLEDLQFKGLVFYREHHGRRYYQVSDPRRLKQILSQQQKEVDQTLPQLLAMYKPSKEKPSVRTYDGVEEIAKIYQELLSASKLDAYGSFDKIERYYPEFKRYLKKQFKRHIKVRDIMMMSDNYDKYRKIYVPPRQQLRILPEGIKLETDTMIFDDKVAIISYADTVHGMIIESKAIADTQSILFEQLWKVSK